MDLLNRESFFIGSSVALSLSIIFGYIFYPFYDYTPFRDYISSLGTGYGAGAYIFNIGVIISGILMVLGFSTLFGEDSIASIFGILGGVGLIGVGIFTATAIVIHSLFAFLFFIMPFIAVSLLFYEYDFIHIAILGIFLVALISLIILYCYGLIFAEWVVVIISIVMIALLGMDIIY